jgi:uncharacterized protein with beta-barrel porin domain
VRTAGTSSPGALNLGGATIEINTWRGALGSPTAVNVGSYAAAGGDRVGTSIVTDFGTHVQRIATAAGGITGIDAAKFLSKVQVNGSSLVSVMLNSGTVLTTPNQLDVSITRRTFASVGGAGNIGKIGGLLDAAVLKLGADIAAGNDNQVLATALGRLETLSSLSAVSGALAIANPAAYAELGNLSIGRVAGVQGALADRLSSLALGPVSGPENYGNGMTAWTSAYGSWQTRDAESSIGVAGYSGNTAGNVSGVEKRFGTVTLGISGALGSTSATFANSMGSVSTDSWHGGLYGQLPMEVVVLDAGFSYGQADSTVKRDIYLGSTRSKIQSTEWVAQFGLSLPLRTDMESVTIVPTLHVMYTGYNQSAANEDALSGLEAKVGSASTNALLTKTGIQALKTMRVFGKPARLGASIDWLHNFNADRREVDVALGASAASARFQSSKAGADAIRAGLSGELGLTDRVWLRLNIDHQVQANQDTTNTRVSVGVQF